MPSSVIDRFWYDREQQTLDVIFVSGRHYRYHGVPEATHRAMKAASSKGEFFNEHVREHFRLTRQD